jgi:hypothetical protein
MSGDENVQSTNDDATGRLQYGYTTNNVLASHLLKNPSNYQNQFYLTISTIENGTASAVNKKQLSIVIRSGKEIVQITLLTKKETAHQNR